MRNKGFCIQEYENIVKKKAAHSKTFDSSSQYLAYFTNSQFKKTLKNCNASSYKLFND